MPPKKRKHATRDPKTPKCRPGYEVPSTFKLAGSFTVHGTRYTVWYDTDYSYRVSTSSSSRTADHAFIAADSLGCQVGHVLVSDPFGGDVWYVDELHGRTPEIEDKLLRKALGKANYLGDVWALLMNDGHGSRYLFTKHAEKTTLHGVLHPEPIYDAVHKIWRLPKLLPASAGVKGEARQTRAEYEARLRELVQERMIQHANESVHRDHAIQAHDNQRQAMYSSNSE